MKGDKVSIKMDGSYLGMMLDQRPKMPKHEPQKPAHAGPSVQLFLLVFSQGGLFLISRYNPLVSFQYTRTHTCTCTCTCAWSKTCHPGTQSAGGAPSAFEDRKLANLLICFGFHLDPEMDPKTSTKVINNQVQYWISF